jgi:hypothetical protein
MRAAWASVPPALRARLDRSATLRTSSGRARVAVVHARPAAARVKGCSAVIRIVGTSVAVAIVAGLAATLGVAATPLPLSARRSDQ